MQIEILSYDNFKKILYQNEDGIAQRVLILDLNDNVIQDKICEYDNQGKQIADVVFASDYTTITGMRKYTDNGSEDYRLIDGKLCLVQTRKSEWLDSDTAKTGFYDNQGQLVAYNIAQRDADESIGMISTGWFDKHGNEMDLFNPPNEFKSLKEYSDY